MIDLPGIADRVTALADAVDAAVLQMPQDDELGAPLRLAVALRIAQLTQSPRWAEELSARLTAAGADAALLSAVATPEKWASVLPSGWSGVLEYAELLALDPDDVAEDELAGIQGAAETPGLSVRAVVQLSQLIGYASFLARLVLVADALAESAAPTAIATAPADASAAAPPLIALRPVGDTVFPVYRWQPRIAPAAPEPGAPKPTPFASVLLHDPAVFAARTSLYDEIMTGGRQEDRPLRELAALATSLVNGCRYCASVHGRRYGQLHPGSHDAEALAVDGIGTLTGIEAAVARAAARLAVTPPAFGSADVDELVAAGASRDEASDLLASAAMFAWANRLMLSLGDPVTRAAQPG